LKYCPEEYDGKFCISAHAYLFKHSWNRYPDQYWAEIIAYRIGKLMKFSVPPSFAAYDSVQGIAGSLTEWFYSYDNTNNQRYIAGGDWMSHITQGFDRDKGTMHNYDSIRVLCKALSRSDAGKLTTDWKEYWANCFLFDSLIGNTDRHQENWGTIVTTRDEQTPVSVSFAPYFDNGTSLGHEIDQQRRDRMGSDDAHMGRYVNRGRHHMKSKADGKKVPHMSFIDDIQLNDKAILASLLEKLAFSNEEVNEILEPMTNITTIHPLTKSRAHYTQKLICSRRDRLTEQITKHL
jgi:hypothetical protein